MDGAAGPTAHRKRGERVAIGMSYGGPSATRSPFHLEGIEVALRRLSRRAKRRIGVSETFGREILNVHPPFPVSAVVSPTPRRTMGAAAAAKHAGSGSS